MGIVTNATFEEIEENVILTWENANNYCDILDIDYVLNIFQGGTLINVINTNETIAEFEIMIPCSLIQVEFEVILDGYTQDGGTFEHELSEHTILLFFQ